jgi:PAS domain-containing protein
VETRQAKHLVLILAREFASNLATPTLVADERGQIVFYNDAAADVPLDEWVESFSVRTSDLELAPRDTRPTRIALDERRPAHERFRITSRDGVERDVSVTAIPLFAHADEFVGMVAVFWRD